MRLLVDSDQIPMSSDEHKAVRDKAVKKVHTVVPGEKFKTFDMSAVINKLDEMQLGTEDWRRSKLYAWRVDSPNPAKNAAGA